MQILEVSQGSAEWIAARAQHLCASEAPAALGVSKYQKRGELLKQKATGITPEVGEAKQRLFDRGHAAEAPAREMAESIIGAELYPVTCTATVEGLPLLASMDGLTMDERIGFEHKLWNEGLAEQVRRGDLEPHYTVQMDHQLVVSGAEKILFMCSDGTPERMVWCWYAANEEGRSALLAGLKQFEADVAAYQPAEVVPAVVAEPVQALPAVLVKVTGEIAITANFGAFETALRDFLEHRLIREPKTDQDFADLDLQIKAMKGAEAALDAAETQMLAQIQTVDTAKKTKDMLAALVRTNRLMAEKLLASEKERRKAEIVADGQAKLREHISALTRRTGVAIMGAGDFAGVIKGKKNLASMEDAISTELARCKIESNRIADLIDENRRAMDAAEAGHLFPDFTSVCTKAAEDFAAQIVGRKAQAAATLEKEREKIRAEEAEKLAREAQAKAAEAARIEREAAEQKAREEAAAQALADAEARAAAQREADERSNREAAEAHARNQAVAAAAQADATAKPVQPAPAPEVRAFTPRAAAQAAEDPTLSLGRISAALGFTVTADLLTRLGFTAHVVKSARLYRPSQFPDIKRALIEHIEATPDEIPLAA